MLEKMSFQVPSTGCPDSWPLVMIKRLLRMINIHTVHEITTYINNIRNVPQKTTHVTADSSAEVPAAQTPREERKENWISGLFFAELCQPSLEGSKYYSVSAKANPSGIVLPVCSLLPP